MTRQEIEDTLRNGFKSGTGVDTVCTCVSGAQVGSGFINRECICENGAYASPDGGACHCDTGASSDADTGEEGPAPECTTDAGVDA